MSWFRKYPFFAIGLTLCGFVIVGELALIFERVTAQRDALRRLEERKAGFEAMEKLTPPPTREVATAIEADLAKAQKSLAAMQAELSGHGPAAERLATAKVPAARTDSFFDLATFVERMKELAEKNSVEVRPEAKRFGFSLYANEGPETDRIEPVFRQRLIAEYLLTALLEARPRVLFSVKRELTVTKSEREARGDDMAPEEPSGDLEGDSSDFFQIDPRVSARVRGYISTAAFRFVFAGQTATLRNFLNRLASFELPVVVREVEVDLASAEDMVAPAATESEDAPETEASAASSIVLAAEPAAPDAEAKPVRPTRVSAVTPIVQKSFSKYIVTVEFLELVPVKAASAEEPAAGDEEQPAAGEEQTTPPNP